MRFQIMWRMAYVSLRCSSWDLESAVVVWVGCVGVDVDVDGTGAVVDWEAVASVSCPTDDQGGCWVVEIIGADVGFEVDGNGSWDEECGRGCS